MADLCYVMMTKHDTGKPYTAHTTNPVPLYLVVPQLGEVRLRSDGILADVSPSGLRPHRHQQQPIYLSRRRRRFCFNGGGQPRVIHIISRNMWIRIDDCG
jgi:hypothetical protein